MKHKSSLLFVLPLFLLFSCGESIPSATTTTETTESTINTALSLRQEIIQRMTVTDTVEPNCHSDLLKIQNQTYIFKVGTTKYAYSLLTKYEQYANNYSLTSIVPIQGIHIWIYDGNEEPLSVNEPLPNTEGLTFHFIDPSVPNITEFSYSLRPYKKNTATRFL